MSSLKRFFTQLDGWRCWSAAILAGGVASLSMPPLGAWPVLAPCFMVLLWLLDDVSSWEENQKNDPFEHSQNRGRRAFLIGWGFGFGFFLLSLYWISFALTVDLERFWWLLPFSAFGPPTVLALYSGVATWATWRLTRSWTAKRANGARLLRWRIARILTFAVFWTTTEWLRGHLFTGFPWNLMGHAWVGTIEVLQVVSITGIYGLSLMTVCCAGLLTLLGEVAVPRKPAWTVVVSGAVFLAAIFGFGAIRLTYAPPLPSSANKTGIAQGMTPGVRLRLIQPNILQSDKWDPIQRDIIFSRHLELAAGYLAPGDQIVRGPSAPATQTAAEVGSATVGSATVGSAAVGSAAVGATAVEPEFGAGNGSERFSEPSRRLIIWPETAVSSFLDADGARRMAIASVTPTGGLHLVGAPRMTFDAERRRHFWNSLVMIDGSGAVVETYDKFHLVPFGEYVPLRRWLPSWLPVSSIAAGTAEFSAGTGARTIRVAGIPAVSPLICYEGIFPGEVTHSRDRPEWLLSVTNDAWYGRTAGPHQHFAMTQTRAVEEGLPLVRAANTGISGIVDGYGRIIASLKLGVGGVVDSGLPLALSPTVYARFGDMIFAGLLALATLAIMALRRH
ncbi:Apolipoprotein N-acyltransferase [Azospirillaceae bacterium]